MQNVRKKTADCKPWYTRGILNVCKKIKYIKHGSLKKDLGSEQRYNKNRNKLTLIMRKAEQWYCKNKLEKRKGDVKRAWSIINAVISKGKVA